MILLFSVLKNPGGERVSARGLAPDAAGLVLGAASA